VCPAVVAPASLHEAAVATLSLWSLTAGVFQGWRPPLPTVECQVTTWPNSWAMRNFRLPLPPTLRSMVPSSLA
jgi:hypothetical protein